MPVSVLCVCVAGCAKASYSFIISFCPPIMKWGHFRQNSFCHTPSPEPSDVLHKMFSYFPMCIHVLDIISNYKQGSCSCNLIQLHFDQNHFAVYLDSYTHTYVQIVHTYLRYLGCALVPTTASQL